MIKKYEFVENDTKTLIDGTVLYRIRAVRDNLGRGLKPGDLGGFIEKEENLPHDDSSWVDFYSLVLGEHTRIRHCTVEYSTVRNSSLQFSTVRNSSVYDSKVVISDIEDSMVDLSLVQNTTLRNGTVEYSTIEDSVVKDSKVKRSQVKTVRIVNGEILCDEQHILFNNIGVHNGRLTAYRAETGVWVMSSFFSGTLEEFETAVNEKYGDNLVGQEYRHLIALIKLRASTWKKEG